MIAAMRWLKAAGALAVVGLAAPAGAQTATYFGVLSGANEVGAGGPAPNASTAFGTALLTLMGNSLTVNVDWTGLTGGNPAAAHIHCCVAPHTVSAPVAVGFPGFPTTITGSYTHTFDLTDASIYTSGFLNGAGGGTAAGAEAALINGLNAGMAYVNIHNRTFPGGEIQADVTTTPEPSTYLLMATGLGALGVVARRRRRS